MRTCLTSSGPRKVRLQRSTTLSLWCIWSVFNCLWGIGRGSLCLTLKRQL